MLAICERCGQTFERRVGRAKRYCQPCALARVVEAGNDNRAKAGEVYERTVRRQLLYWRSEAARLNIRA